MVYILGMPRESALYIHQIRTRLWPSLQMCKVGQDRTYAPYMTVYLVISLPKMLYIHCIYRWFWPTLQICNHTTSLYDSGNHTTSLYDSGATFSHPMVVGSCL